MYICMYVCVCLVLLYVREDTCATEREHAWVSIGGVYWTDRRGSHFTHYQQPTADRLKVLQGETGERESAVCGVECA